MSVHILEAVRLTLIGMGVVFSSLLGLYLVMVLVARTIGRQSNGPAASAERGGVPEEGIAPEVVAAIFAAVHAAVGPDARPRTIRVARGRRSAGPPIWALTGRQGQMMAQVPHGPAKGSGRRNTQGGQ